MEITRSAARRRTLAVLAGTAVIAVAVQISATAGTTTGTDTHRGAGSAAAKGTNAEPPADYYADAEGKTGEELKTALHTIISKDAQRSRTTRSGTRSRRPTRTRRTTATSSCSTPASPTQQDNNGGDADDWNREHVWAKSHGDFGTGNRSRHRRPPPAPDGCDGQQHPRQQGLRQGRRGGRGARPAASPTRTPSSRVTRSRATSPA